METEDEWMARMAAHRDRRINRATIDTRVKKALGIKDKRGPKLKLTPSEIVSIRQEYIQDNTPQMQLAEKYKVSQPTISRILKHLT